MNALVFRLANGQLSIGKTQGRELACIRLFIVFEVIMWPKEYGRFNVLLENHIGFGVRWSDWVYPFEISLSIPFVSFTFGFGRRKLV
jgi:hypothetical protein